MFVGSSFFSNAYSSTNINKIFIKNFRNFSIVGYNDIILKKSIARSSVNFVQNKWLYSFCNIVYCH